jgi:hypothetical protein
LTHQPMDHLRKELLGLVLKPMQHRGSAKREYGFHSNSLHSVTHNQALFSVLFALESGSNLVTSGVGIAKAMGWTARFRFPAVEEFSLLHSVKAGSKTRALSPGVKWQGRQVDHCPATSAEVKNGAAIAPHSPPPPIGLHGTVLN